MLRNRLANRIGDLPRIYRMGRVTRVVGLVIEAAGLDVGLGELCRVTSLSDEKSVLAEVVGFHERGVMLMPLGEMTQFTSWFEHPPLGRSFGAGMGPGLLGRVLNGLGHPMEASARSTFAAHAAHRQPPHPLDRSIITEPFETGVRAIDGYLTLGKGPRVGISPDQA